MNIYGFRVTFYNRTYSVSGYSSELEAKLAVYGRAFEDGVWAPPRLREKWWQLWRPAQHNEIEAHFAALEQRKPNEHSRH